MHAGFITPRSKCTRSIRHPVSTHSTGFVDLQVELNCKFALEHPPQGSDAVADAPSGTGLARKAGAKPPNAGTAKIAGR